LQKIAKKITPKSNETLIAGHRLKRQGKKGGAKRQSIFLFECICSIG